MTVVALSTDRNNSLPEFFEEHRRPDIVAGWVGPLARQEVSVEELPAVFVLDANRTVMFFTHDPDGDYRTMRALLNKMEP